MLYDNKSGNVEMQCGLLKVATEMIVLIQTRSLVLML